jgi:hypothetical protein
MKKRCTLGLLVLVPLAGGLGWLLWPRLHSAPAPPAAEVSPRPPLIGKLWNYSQNRSDDSGLVMVWTAFVTAGKELAPDDLRAASHHAGYRGSQLIREEMQSYSLSPAERLEGLLILSRLYLYEGEFNQAITTLEEARTLTEEGPAFLQERQQDVLFLLGVASLRRGEVDNCVECACDCSCIFPLAPPAFHQKRQGSTQAMRYFSECLRRDPNDLRARWLLNIAAMTLGEYPERVPRAYLLPATVGGPQADVGAFTDIAARVGVTRLNQAGGAIMDDFDRDGLLDILISSMDPGQSMAFFRNRGDGTFEDRTKAAGLDRLRGGLNCVQADYDNDGFLDVFVCRGGWTGIAQRPSLLRNRGDGTFLDVTEAAGVQAPVDSQVAAWADYDNDGWLDLFVAAENGRCRLYHNRGNSTFTEVAVAAGIVNEARTCKGAAWGDYDGDGFPDLFVTSLTGPPRLFHNKGDGTFTEVTEHLGLKEPSKGFSCWFWDYDNDGWLDIFACGYETALHKVVQSQLGRPHDGMTPRLYRNKGDGTFADVTRAVGLDQALCPMGSNFVDVDNDGFLDVYLGTGTPDYSMLVPNRLLLNRGGKRFLDATVSSRTGHLQKGHAVACGDWDRDGNVDIYEEMGGATPGDLARNVLFQNPGHDSHWITLVLVGTKTNRAAIGARIKVTLAGGRTIYRHVSSGSSFGANSLQQTIGLGASRKIDRLEVYWPVSRTTQTFTDVGLDEALEIRELEASYRRLHWAKVKGVPGR